MLNQTKIFMVRHGQTEWNKANRLQGHQNSPLTDLGKDQARQVKGALDKYVMNKAYVSPLQRAQDTLTLIIGKQNIEVVVCEDLMEMNLGPWEGKTKSETALSDPIQYQRFWNNPAQFSLIGAETYQQLQDRVVGQLKRIFTKEKGNNIIVVSHGVAIKVAMAYFNATSLDNLSSLPVPENGEFIVLSDPQDNQ